MVKLTVQPSKVHYMHCVDREDDSYSITATVSVNTGGLVV